jgi:uncharacterized membrane protein
MEGAMKKRKGRGEGGGIYETGLGGGGEGGLWTILVKGKIITGLRGFEVKNHSSCGKQGAGKYTLIHTL